MLSRTALKKLVRTHPGAYLGGQNSVVSVTTGQILGYVCQGCGKFASWPTFPMVPVCFECEKKLEAEQVALVAAGAPCTCGCCGASRDGFDWATGKTRAGIGLCEKCFVGRVDLITNVIKNQPTPLRALVVMASGVSKKRERQFAQGTSRPTAKEVYRAMGTLVRREGYDE
jgi:hypothetical protein